MQQRETYQVEINGVRRELPLFEVAPGLRIAVLNILGDTELTEAAARGLADAMRALDFDVFITAEAKSIPLAHAISVATGKPYIVLRKSYKPYMGEAIESETLSITTGKKQVLILDEKDHQRIRGKRAVLLDDVISTGSTLNGMREIIEQAEAEIVAKAAICTEGEPGDWADVYALAHLPLFKS